MKKKRKGSIFQVNFLSARLLSGKEEWQLKEILKRLKLNESNIGFGLGIAVMVLAGWLLISYFRSVNTTPSVGQTSSLATDEPAMAPTDGEEVMEEPTVIEPRGGEEYVIRVGDSLWKISQRTYGTGYSWTKIYESNRDVLGNNPSQLAIGTRIKLPQPEEAVLNYTVSRGDNLWNIAVKMCGDGFMWSGIARSNNLENPRLIQPGLELKIRCK